MIAAFERLPAWARVLLASAALTLAAMGDLAFIVKTDPWRPSVLVYTVLGALAAWPFRWRVRTRADQFALATGLTAFAVAMVWGRITGRLVSSSGFFIFSALTLALPIQRARSKDSAPADAERTPEA